MTRLNDRLEQTRADIKKYNQDPVTSAASHLASTGNQDQAARMLQLGNREKQTRLQDAYHQETALINIQDRAQQLIRLGQKDQAQALLARLEANPNSVINLGIEAKSQALSVTGMQERAFTPLLSRAEASVNSNFDQMSPEEQRDHTMGLVARLDQGLERSAADFVLNETMVDSLEGELAYRRQAEQKPQTGLPGLASTATNPFAPTQNPATETPSSPIEDHFKKQFAQMSDFQIKAEIDKRTELRQSLIQSRTKLLEQQAQTLELIQTRQAALIHELFKPEDERSREVQIALDRDYQLEQDYATMQDSLLGLSPEEQTVRARDFTSHKLQEQRDTLRLLDQQSLALDHIGQDESISISQRLALVDQSIINNLTTEEIEKRADLLFNHHDSLTESLNSQQYDQAVKHIDKFGSKLESHLYTYEDQNRSDTALRNDDLSRTPKEDSAIKARITELEAQFDGLTEEQLEEVRVLSKRANADLDQTVTQIRDTSLNPYKADTAALLMGNHDLEFARISSDQNHVSRIVGSLLEAKRTQVADRASYTEQGQLENYQKSLEDIITRVKAKHAASGQEYMSDFGRNRARFNSLDRSYQSTEDAIEFATKSTVIIGATIATGGTATTLMGANWGVGASSFMALGAGTGAGTAIGFGANLAEGYSREVKGFNDPYSQLASKTYDDFKTSFLTAAGTASGIGIAKHLVNTGRWGQRTANLASALSSSAFTTSLDHGIRAGESLYQTGETNFDGESFLTDLKWNAASSGIGSGIGSNFGRWQEAAGKGLVRQALLHGGEEVLSLGADMALTLQRGGEITTDGLLESLRASITGRVQGHYSQKQAAAHQRSIDALTKTIQGQDITLKPSEDLPEGVNGQARVKVSPDGSRSVEVEVSQRIIDAALAGDKKAQAILLEETYAHAREKPIDPMVKQADGSHKAMSQEKYSALRARQELIAKSTGAAKTAQINENSVSKAKQEHQQKIKAVDSLIKAGKYEKALKLANLEPADLENYAQDYQQNTSRNPRTEALSQTSNSTDAQTEESTRITSLDNPRMQDVVRDLDAMQEADGTVTAQIPGVDTVPQQPAAFNPTPDAKPMPKSDTDSQAVSHAKHEESQATASDAQKTNEPARLNAPDDTTATPKPDANPQTVEQAKHEETQVTTELPKPSSKTRGRKPKTNHPDFETNSEQFKTDFIASVEQRHQLADDLTTTTRKLLTLDPTHPEYQSTLSQLKGLDTEINKLDSNINERRQTFMQHFRKDSPFVEHPKPSDFKDPTQESIYREERGRIEKEIANRINEIDQKALERARAQLGDLSKLTDQQILDGLKQASDTKSRTDPNDPEGLLDSNLQELYQMRERLENSFAYHDDTSPLKTLTDSIASNQRLDLESRVELHRKLSLLQNSTVHPELTQQFLKDLSTLNDIPGIETLVHDAAAVLGNENGDDYGPLRGHISTAKRARALSEAGVSIEAVEQTLLSTRMTDSSGNDSLARFRDIPDINARKAAMIKTGFITAKANGSGRHKITNPNGENFYLDIKDLKIYTANNQEVNLIHSEGNYRMVPDIDVIASGKFLDSDGNLSFEGRIFIENKLNLATLIGKNARLINSNNADGTQLANMLVLSKSNSADRLGLIADLSIITKPDASLDTQHPQYQAMVKILNNIKQAYPESNGFPPIMILDSRGIDRSSEFGLK